MSSNRFERGELSDLSMPIFAIKDAVSALFEMRISRHLENDMITYDLILQ